MPDQCSLQLRNIKPIFIIVRINFVIKLKLSDDI